MKRIILVLLLLAFMQVSLAQVTLRVLTFNIWGLFIAPDRRLRLEALIDQLVRPSAGGAIQDHDVVALQELWSPDDYQRVKLAIVDSYPYSHHFTHGTVGSGLAIFSKYPFLRITFVPYVLNGHPSQPFDGECFAGKGIGHVRISHPIGIVDLFTTHLVADYSDRTVNSDGAMGEGILLQRKDEYLSQRITQAYQLAQFISAHTHQRSRNVIVLGDMNFEPDTLPWRILKSRTCWETKALLLQSVWDDLEPDKRPCTCNCPDNFYLYPQGKSESSAALFDASLKAIPITIDHIFYNAQQLVLERASVAFNAPIKPGKGHPKTISYSDHFAVTAVFKAVDDPQPVVPPQDEQVCDLDVWRESLTALKKEIGRAAAGRRDGKIRVMVSGFVALILAASAIIAILSSTSHPRWAIITALLILPLSAMILLWNTLLTFLAFPCELSGLQQFLAEFNNLISNP